MKSTNYLTSLILLLFSCVTFAQPGDTDGTPTDNLEGTDPPADINTVLFILAFVGIFYALHTFNKNRKLT